MGEGHLCCLEKNTVSTDQIHPRTKMFEMREQRSKKKRKKKKKELNS